MPEIAQNWQPPAFWHGSPRPKILLLGEAWGETEDEQEQPFVGSSGQELWRMLGQVFTDSEPDLHARALTQKGWDFDARKAWLCANGLALFNVFNFRPPSNNLDFLCGKRSDDVLLPAYRQGKYFLTKFAAPALTLLQECLAASQPNLVVALGNCASWAMLEATNISSIRGSISFPPPNPQFLSPKGRNLLQKVLPTYHPAGVMRQWSWRPIVIADLMKAKREGDSPNYVRPSREILVNPTLDEIRAWIEKFLLDNPPILSSDIETMGGQISCISFSYDKASALVVPFIRLQPKWQSYWPSAGDEVAAWELVQMILEHPVTKLGQNFIYDLQYITRMGIRPRNCLADLMLGHHSLHPEMQKGLGFMGSIYTDEPSWKLMRRQRIGATKLEE